MGTREGGVFVWSVYGPDGVPKRRDTHALNPDGRRRTVMQTYAPDGSLARRKVLDSDAAATELRVVVKTGGEAPPARTRETREHDSRKNLIKQTRYVWNEAAGKFELSSVTYYTITYYR
jgi:hypothetical protein